MSVQWETGSMVIIGPVTPVNTGQNTGKQDTSGLANLRPGQILNAVTLNTSQNGHINIRIGNIEITALTNNIIQKNVQLTLKVTQLQPQLVLQIVGKPHQVAATNPLKQALIRLLPQQSGITTLFTNKGVTQNTNPGNNLRTLQNTLINTIATRADITQAPGLRQAIIQSGVFLEAQLGSTKSGKLIDFSGDIKAVLLRLLRDISKSNNANSSNNMSTSDSTKKQGITNTQTNTNPPAPLKGRLPVSQPTVKLDQSAMKIDASMKSVDITKNIESALSRVVLHQIATVENLNDGRNMWHLEIPILNKNDINTLALTIEKEHAQKDSGEEKTWNINLALDLPHLGSLQIKITLHNHAISSTFWSESSATQAVIDNQLEHLRSRLSKQGINSINMVSVNGSQTAPESTKRSTPLLDIQV